MHERNYLAYICKNHVCLFAKLESRRSTVNRVKLEEGEEADIVQYWHNIKMRAAIGYC